MSQEFKILQEFYENSSEYQIDFLNYLKNKPLPNLSLMSYIQKDYRNSVRSNYYYNMLSFKTLFCEIIYNAIQLFPDITEYTIICKNEYTSTIKIGCLSEMDDENELGIAKITNRIVGNVILSKQDIYDLYTSNRSMDSDNNNINAILALLYPDGNIPQITTSYISKPNKFKSF